MTRKQTKLAVVANENLRAIILKKKRVGLVRMIRELTILCDVMACPIMVSPNEAEPMVWPSIEVARGLLDDLFALLEFEKKKKETTVESYLKEKTKRVHDQIKRTQKKSKEYEIDHLIVQLDGDRRPADLNLNVIYELISFSKDKIMHLRRILHLMHHPPLPDPPVNPFKVQYEEARTTINDIFMTGSGQDDGRATVTDEGAQNIINTDTLRENHSHYLIDQWVFQSSELPNPQIHQQVRMEMASYSQIPNLRCYLPCQESCHPYQRSSRNGNQNISYLF